MFAIECLQCQAQAVASTSVCFRNTLSNLRAAIASTNEDNPSGSRIHHKYLINHYEDKHPDIMATKPQVGEWYKITLLDSATSKEHIQELTETWLAWLRPGITSKITNRMSEKQLEKDNENKCGLGEFSMLFGGAKK